MEAMFACTEEVAIKFWQAANNALSCGRDRVVFLRLIVMISLSDETMV